MSNKPRARADLFGIRSTIPASSARLLSSASLLLVLATWCVLSYVHVERGGKSDFSRG
jgi:hypothetical protein